MFISLIRKRRMIWVHEINLTRDLKSEFHTLYQKLREDKQPFFIYFLMGFSCFDELLNLIKNDIQKQYTTYREPIDPMQRLAVTLR